MIVLALFLVLVLISVRILMPFFLNICFDFGDSALCYPNTFKNVSSCTSTLFTSCSSMQLGQNFFGTDYAHRSFLSNSQKGNALLKMELLSSQFIIPILHILFISFGQKIDMLFYPQYIRRHLGWPLLHDSYIPQKSVSRPRIRLL